MKLKKLLTLAALALTASSISAQTVNVPFSTNAAGKSLPINWGMDAAWDWDYNVMRGIAHYGKNFTTGRISFQPYNLVDASKINDASADFGLSAGQVRRLQWRIDLIKRTGTTEVEINCDHEALFKVMNADGTLGDNQEEGKRTGYNNYVTSDVAENAKRWYNLIKASVKYAQNQGLKVVSVAPFNESDFGWCQYTYEIEYNDFTRAKAKSQINGQKTFLEIAKLIKADDFFKDIRVCGGNTLSAEYALSWYNYLKAYLDEGNTHQLAGTFDQYADFFTTVSQDGKVATADEVHNVGEAMVGVEYGMQNAIWWGFDSKARGQFMHDSNEGVRLGYAEDRSHWTSAAVYRNDQDGEIHGFIGSSERQANVSTYNFQCQDREVYFNGYGPQKEWSVTTIGGASGSYQNGQINYERLFDITYGEDVQSFPVDGNYQIMSAADMKLVTSNGYWADNNHLSAAAQANSDSQRWHIYPGRSDGDCSYWFIDNVGDANQHWNLLNGGGAGALEAGSRVICYNAGHDALEQWYLRYAKDGYFYIMARQSNKYLYNNDGTLSLQDAPTKTTGANELKKYMWRLMPTDAVAEQTAPATPTGLAEGTVNATSASFSWTAVSEANVTYNVLRQDANGWNTIARLQSGNTYTDNKVEAGKGYRYKVQAVDYSGNRSEASEVITIIVPEENTSGYTAGQWQWTGETAAAGSFYIYNKANNVWLKKTSAVDATPANATLFTISGTSNATISYSDNGTKYVYESGGNQSWGTTNTNKWTIQSQTGGYYIYHRDPGYSWSTRNRYISLSNSAVSYPYQSFTNANRLLQFISESQMTKYGKMSEYTTAFNAAAGYLSKNISSDLKTRLESTLEACDGTINKDTNIDNYISQLKSIAEECQTYLNNNTSSEPEDFTGFIINPTIIQNGTTNDAPTGWIGATTNVTGNGHWTEGTGDTRLEAWHWTSDLNAEYYQDVIVPNGLYTLTAITHQRENGNAALFGETYKSFETKMPVGDGNEAQTDVKEILVTDGIIRIGMKVSGSGNWATADDFTLTRVSTPENTDLSHYTDAIAYLNTEAEAELGRNIDHTELIAAYNAANSCEANVAAYETAINNLFAAIQKSKAMVAAEPVLSGSWIGQTGNYAGDFAERYNGDTPYPAGHILYQVVEDLIPGAQYEIQFYAVANVARNLANSYAGNGIAYLFANDTEEDINVIYQDGCTPTNYPRTLRAVADENGQIAYGIANRKAGGQWYVAKAQSITFLGMPHTANLSVAPSKYGTFVAPFDIIVPEGVMTYTPSVTAGSKVVELTEKVGAGATLEANTPVIVYNNTGELINKDFTEIIQELPSATVTEGCFVGFYMSNLLIPINGRTYVLQTQNGVQSFYKVGTTFHGTQNRCYLVMPEAQSANVLRFGLDGDEETAIEKIENGKSKMENVIYDLTGRRVSSTVKGGIYIINGRKVVK